MMKYLKFANCDKVDIGIDLNKDGSPDVVFTAKGKREIILLLLGMYGLGVLSGLGLIASGVL